MKRDLVIQILVVVYYFLVGCSMQPVQEEQNRVALSLAQEYILSNQLRQAEIYLDKVSRYQKTTVEFHRIKSLYFMRTSRLDETIKYHEKSLEAFPRDIFLLNNLGVALVRVGEYTKACGLFKKTLEISLNGSQSALINYARCLISKDDVKKATILINRAKEIAKLPYIGLLTELNLVLIQGNYIEASQLNKIIQANSNYTQIIEYNEEHECLSRHVLARETDLTSSSLTPPSACIVPRYKT
ncbi:tetratricopeptide repeat protein [Marinomonas algicola]|uniref:tetratricopeptide repeat protein n=1 Tax=Marinomonas algicola TaxID=2773454 RepID=UPI00174E9030|nr:tetratricopeptide repeat protein [Marinomonas algicola]